MFARGCLFAFVGFLVGTGLGVGLGFLIFHFDRGAGGGGEWVAVSVVGVKVFESAMIFAEVVPNAVRIGFSLLMGLVGVFVGAFLGAGRGKKVAPASE